MSELEKSSGSVSESERSDSGSSSDESSSEWSSLISGSSGVAESSSSDAPSQGLSSASSDSLSSGENPFGILTIVYFWEDQPDLDTGTTFLGSVVGFGHGALSAYMSWTGDNTEDGGSETVTVDLARAWEDGEITDIAEIDCAADWYPFADDDPGVEPNPNPGSGPAEIEVTYKGTVIGKTISPGGATPATTHVAPITVWADGTFAID